MASSYSTDLKLELMVTGENSGTWGDKTNTNLNLLDQAVAGYQNVVLTSTNTTLVMTNATVSNARNAVLKLTGTIAANSTIYVATGITKPYLIDNQTSGAYTVAVNQVGGASVIWETTDKSLKSIYLNGTDAIDTGIVTLTGVQTITNKTLTSPAISSPTITTAATLNAQAELRLADADSSNYVGLKSGTTVNTNIVWTLPTADGTSGQFLKTDGSGNLSFASLSFATPLSVVGDNVAGASIRLPEDTDNGSNYVAIKAPDNLASNLTLTLPSADGTSGQVLQTNGSGVLSFSSPSSDFVLLATTDVTSSTASISFDGYFSSTYKNYIVYFNYMFPTVTLTSPILRYKISGTAQTGRYVYVGGGGYQDVTTAYSSEYGSYSATYIQFSGSISSTGGATYGGTSGKFTIHDPLSTTVYKMITGNSGKNYQNGSYEADVIWGQYTDSLSALSGIQILFTSGNIASGNFKLYGLK